MKYTLVKYAKKVNCSKFPSISNATLGSDLPHYAEQNTRMQQNKIHMEVDTKGIIKISFLRASFPRDISKCTSEIWAHFSSELFQLNGSYKLLGLVIKLNFVILQLKNFNKSMYISVVEFWKITNHTMNSTSLLQIYFDDYTPASVELMRENETGKNRVINDKKCVVLF